MDKWGWGGWGVGGGLQTHLVALNPCLYTFRPEMYINMYINEHMYVALIRTKCNKAPTKKHTYHNRHTLCHRTSCSEVVFYQDHVGHLEPINPAPKVQTLDLRSPPHTITFTMGGNTESGWSPAPCQHLSNLWTCRGRAQNTVRLTCAVFLQKTQMW